jgi:hypothetical protein
MSISPIGSSLQSLQSAPLAPQPTSQSTSGQSAGTGGGAQSAPASSGSASALVFDPATGAMVPVGTVGSSSAANSTTKAPGTVDFIA